MRTEERRPLCQLIFVEEPEVHLHAQAQQTFVSNIWRLVRQAAIDNDEEHMTPQLAISTHSSHIVDAVEFSKVLYFQKCFREGDDPETTTTMNAPKIVSLKSFEPEKESAAGEVEDEQQTLKFLNKYLRLTHRDLFFADGAILVEGAAEKLLISAMISLSAEKLNQSFLTVLELGGSYSFCFASLLEFLGIPTL